MTKPTPCVLCDGDRIDIGRKKDKRVWYCHECGVCEYVLVEPE